MDAFQLLSFICHVDDCKIEQCLCGKEFDGKTQSEGSYLSYLESVALP